MICTSGEGFRVLFELQRQTMMHADDVGIGISLSTYTRNTTSNIIFNSFIKKKKEILSSTAVKWALIFKPEMSLCL